MSSRQAAVDMVRQEGFQRGAEIGVWRGERAWALLDQTDLKYLLLVDPWEESRNRFDLMWWETSPLRMPPGQYHCTMGEPHQDQAALDRMAGEVVARAAAYGSRVTILREPAHWIVPLVPDLSLDFVLVDGIHLPMWVRSTLIGWTRTVRDRGIIAGDGASDDLLIPGITAPVRGLSAPTIVGDWWWRRRLL